MGRKWPVIAADEARRLHDDATAAAEQLVAELVSRHSNPAERSAIFEALKMLAAAAAHDALDEILDQFLLAQPLGLSYTLARLTGLTEPTINRRAAALVRRGLNEGWLVWDETSGRLRRVPAGAVSNG